MKRRKRSKNWNTVKNVKKAKKHKKLFRNDFYGEISKNYPFDKKQAFLTKILSKRFNSLNCLLRNKKYGETVQKLKVGWKRQKL